MSDTIGRAAYSVAISPQEAYESVLEDMQWVLDNAPNRPQEQTDADMERLKCAYYHAWCRLQTPRGPQ